MLKVFSPPRREDKKKRTTTNPLAKIQPKPSFFKNRLLSVSLFSQLSKRCSARWEKENAVPLLSLSFTLRTHTHPLTRECFQPLRSSSSRLLDIMLLCIS